MNPLFKSIQKAVNHWYILLLIGLFFIIVGVVVMVWPEASFMTLALLFSLSFIFSGVAEVVFYLSNKEQLTSWFWPMAFGLVTAILGGIMLANPALSMATLALFIGFIFLFRSISYISYAFELKDYGVKNWLWMLIFGIISTLIAVILILNPVIAGLSLVILVSLNFILVGILNIYLSIHLKKLHQSSQKLSEDLQTRYEELMNDIKDEWGD